MATLVAPHRTRKARNTVKTPIPAPIRGTFRMCRTIDDHEPVIIHPEGKVIVTCDTCEQLLYRGSSIASAVRFAQEFGDGSVFVQDRDSECSFHLSRHQAFIRNVPFTRTVK